MAVDLLLLAVVLACAVHGFRCGASLHVTGLLALVGGAALGVPLARLVRMVTGAAGEASAAGGLPTFVGCFAALWVGIHVVGLGVRAPTHRVAAGASDRLLGGAVGLAHGAVLGVATAGVLLVLAPSLRAPLLDRPVGRLAQRGVAFVDGQVSTSSGAGPSAVSADLLQTSASTQ
ncbi:MAG: CvpA family protein [Planctomycetota bacterium]